MIDTPRLPTRIRLTLGALLGLGLLLTAASALADSPDPSGSEGTNPAQTEADEPAEAAEDTSSEGAPAEPVFDGSVEVLISWENAALPGTMEIYRIKPGKRPKLWETAAVKKLAAAPVGAKYEGSTLMSAAGRVERFVLVMENTTEETLYFFAAPHQVTPAQHSLGFKFKCLCINHAFKIPPGEIWYRVVELRMDANINAPSVDIKHMLIGLDEVRYKDFELPG